MTILTFGKYKNEYLDRTPESYIKWLVSHKNVLSVEHRTASDAAKELLEYREKKAAEVEKAQVSFREGKVFDEILREYVELPSDNALNVERDSKWGYAIQRQAKDRDKALKRAEITDISNRGNFGTKAFSILR